MTSVIKEVELRMLLTGGIMDAVVAPVVIMFVANNGEVFRIV